MNEDLGYDKSKDWRQWFPFRSFFVTKVWFEIAFCMIVKGVNYQKAKATIDNMYYERARTTGRQNFLYRPPEAGEIGPQSTGAMDAKWWEWILIILLILWLINKIKKIFKK